MRYALLSIMWYLLFLVNDLKKNLKLILKTHVITAKSLCLYTCTVFISIIYVASVIFAY